MYSVCLYVRVHIVSLHTQTMNISSSSDDAVAARKRPPPPKSCAITMGVPTPFVTAAAAAAISLCTSLHPSAFKPHFRPKAERERWTIEVSRASLRCACDFCAYLEDTGRTLKHTHKLFSTHSHARTHTYTRKNTLTHSRTCNARDGFLRYIL